MIGWPGTQVALQNFFTWVTGRTNNHLLVTGRVGLLTSVVSARSTSVSDTFRDEAPCTYVAHAEIHETREVWGSTHICLHIMPKIANNSSTKILSENVHARRRGICVASTLNFLIILVSSMNSSWNCSCVTSLLTYTQCVRPQSTMARIHSFDLRFACACPRRLKRERFLTLGHRHRSPQQSRQRGVAGAGPGTAATALPVTLNQVRVPPSQLP